VIKIYALLCYNQMIDMYEMHDFPEQEYERRWKETRKAMASAQLDALFITSGPNYMYFTGHTVTYWVPHWLWTTTSAFPFAFVLPAEKDPVICTIPREAKNARQTTFVTQIRTYSGIPFSAEHYVKMLADSGLSRGRIGCELGAEQRMSMPYKEFTRLQKGLPEVDFVDGTDVIRMVRLIKSREEIERIRKANEITVQALNMLYEKIKVGTTEREAARIVERAMIEYGADRCQFYFTECASTGNTPIVHPRPLERAFEVGECVYVDLGAAYKNYIADVNRTIAFGRATAQMNDTYAVVLECEKAMFKAAKPGARTRDVCLAFERVMKEAGYGDIDLYPFRVGHGVGMGIEPPSLSKDDETVLKNGMVIGIEPRISKPFGYITVEDEVVVTSTGNKVLTPGPRELVEIA